VRTPANLRVAARNLGAWLSFDPVVALVGGPVSYNLSITVVAGQPGGQSAASPAPHTSPPSIVTKDCSLSVPGLLNGIGKFAPFQCLSSSMCIIIIIIYYYCYYYYYYYFEILVLLR